MKTAEEWITPLLNAGAVYADYVAIVRLIQLDAFRAGMTKAAETLDKRLLQGYDAMHVTAILTARDNLKELP